MTAAVVGPDGDRSPAADDDTTPGSARLSDVHPTRGALAPSFTPPFRNRSRARLVAVALIAVGLIAFGAARLTGAARSHPARPAPLPANGFRVEVPAPLSGDDEAAAVRRGDGRWGAVPVRHIVLPSLHIDARWIRVGTDRAGGLRIPVDVRQVGLWTGGAAPTATRGTTLLAGHVNYTGQGNGALHRLFRVRPGALVVLTGDRAERTVWRVVELQVFAKTALPRRIFDADGVRRLVLVTCGGPLLRITGADGTSYNTYRDNVVVTAEPVA